MEVVDIVVLLNIVSKLNDHELTKLCQTNRKFRGFCSENNIALWKQRFIRSLGKYYEKFNEGPVIDVINKYREQKNISWMKYYFYVMENLERHFISLLEDIPEDMSKLITIMETEPFFIFFNNMYTENKTDETIYNNLTEQEKHWVSPDALLFHIMVGNITDPNIISMIRSYNFPLETMDTIANSLLENNTKIDGLLLAKEILEKMLLRNITIQDRNNINYTLKDVKRMITLRKIEDVNTSIKNIFLRAIKK